LQALRVQRDGAVGGRERVGELLLLQRGIGIFLIRLQRQRFVLIRHGAGFVERAAAAAGSPTNVLATPSSV